MADRSSFWRSSLRIYQVLLGITLFIVLAYVLRSTFSAPPAEAVAAPDLGGSFELIDQRGIAVSDADYRGRPALLYFGFASCGDVCPTDLAKMGFVADRLAAKEDIRITPIFVTIDPARDTAERLASYVPSFHPDFVGLTGSPEAIAAIADKYAVYYSSVPMGDTYMMDHSTRLFLLDEQGRYVAHFGRDLTVDDLVTQISQKLAAGS